MDGLLMLGDWKTSWSFQYCGSRLSLASFALLISPGGALVRRAASTWLVHHRESPDISQSPGPVTLHATRSPLPMPTDPQASELNRATGRARKPEKEEVYPGSKGKWGQKWPGTPLSSHQHWCQAAPTLEELPSTSPTNSS